MANRKPGFSVAGKPGNPTAYAAIAKGAAIIFATVYLRHSLPVSGISFFNTLCRSKPSLGPYCSKPRTLSVAPLLRGLVSPSPWFAETLG